MTTADVAPAAAATMASVSSTLRRASARSEPGKSGTNGAAPGERTSAS